jgi:transposase
MAGRRISVLDVREMVRRFRLGETERRVARDMGLSRNTVARYRDWAALEGFLIAAELPEPELVQKSLERLAPERTPGPTPRAADYKEFILEKRRAGVEVQALFLLLKERGYSGCYTSLLRYVRRLEPREKEVFLRIETPPGEEAQVDFGFVGRIFDESQKRLRKAWVFVMTLSFSRHQYAEVVFDQKVETWVALHSRAFEFFGGVPRRVVLDNLKAGIANAVVHDAEAQRSYRELAEHYGFLISPCRPGTPRHKGKVESGVHYAKRNALAGRDFKSRVEINTHLLNWILNIAGRRDHGTTHEEPLKRFERERSELQALPPSRYEVVVWKKAKLHPDCHVVFEYSFYSAPFRFVSEELWVRSSSERVEIYREHERVAAHRRAYRRGEWSTVAEHCPPEKVQGLLPAPVEIKTRAQEIGTSTATFVELLLGQRPLDRLRSAQAVVALARRYGPKRLEAACRRALAFNDIRYHTVKSILQKGLDGEPIGEGEERVPLPKTAIFARPISELVPLN